jgi:hypothetical protein
MILRGRDHDGIPVKTVDPPRAKDNQSGDRMYCQVPRQVR